MENKFFAINKFCKNSLIIGDEELLKARPDFFERDSLKHHGFISSAIDFEVAKLYL